MSGTKPYENGEFKTFFSLLPSAGMQRTELGEMELSKALHPPEQEAKHTFTPWQGCRGSLGTGQQIRGYSTDISLPQQNSSANLLLDLSARSSLVVVLSGDNSLNGMRYYRESLAGMVPTCRAGAVGHGKGQIPRESSSSHCVPWLDGEQQAMGAPLAFTPRKSPARDANPGLPVSSQRSS